MMSPEQQIADSLKFQLSLLKLAEIADANRGTTPATAHTDELKQLIEKVPVRKRRK